MTEPLIRKVTLAQLGPGGGYLEEYPQPLWQGFQVSAQKAKELLIARASDPLCSAIGYYLNGEYFGKWALDHSCESNFRFIPSPMPVEGMPD